MKIEDDEVSPPLRFSHLSPFREDFRQEVECVDGKKKSVSVHPGEHLMIDNRTCLKYRFEFSGQRCF